MKKFILMFIMLIGMVATSQAEVQYYRTTGYAQARIYNNTYYWGEWETSNMTLVIDTNKDVIVIYSPQTQIYKVVDEGKAYYDTDGGSTLAFLVIDQTNYLRGKIRLHVDTKGNSQLYVDFADIAWVYSVIRTQ